MLFELNLKTIEYSLVKKYSTICYILPSICGFDDKELLA